MSASAAKWEVQVTFCDPDTPHDFKLHLESLLNDGWEYVTHDNRVRDKRRAGGNIESFLAVYSKRKRS
jgi:hypothetical protein